MNLTAWFRCGSGRRRFDAPAAQAEIRRLRERLAELEPEAAEAQALRLRVAELGAELDTHAVMDAAQQREIEALRAQVELLTPVGDDEGSVSVGAPIDEHPEAFGERTQEIRVITLQAKFGATPVPRMPVTTAGAA